MKTAALLVGVSDYQTYLTTLGSAAPEMARWSEILLLPRYGCDRIEYLAEADATKTNILAKLTALLSELDRGDLLVFAFGGHGCLLDPGEGDYEQVLLAYPEGDKTFSKAAITGADLARAMNAAESPEGIAITFITDTCYSGRLNIPGTAFRGNPLVAPFVLLTQEGDDPAGARILVRESEEPPSPDPSATRGIRDLAAQLGLFLEAKFQRPIILAASGRDQLAFEITVEGIPRLLFSARAQKKLRARKVAPTYRQLIDSINPLHPRIPQTATITGDTSRENERFLGQSVSDDPQNSALQSDEIDATAITGSLNVRVDGIACWIKGREKDAFPRRLAMPYDPRTDEHRHIAFVEIANEDIDRVTGAAATEEYFHVEFLAGTGGGFVQTGNVKYSRWNLTGHRITITMVAETPEHSVTPAFVRHVPQMKKVLPDLDSTPDSDCFSADPSPNLIAGLLDVYGGTLDVGTLQEYLVSFDPQRQWPPETREPEFVVYRLPIVGATVKVSITAFAGSSGQDTEITLKPGTAWIRVGNEQLADIKGPGSGENQAEFFELYYKLSDPKTLATIPPPLPRPRKSAAPINACTNSTWP